MTTQSRLVRVFISSTFRDFIEERDELVKKVFPELRRRCKERFVEVLEVDLRWGITEEQSKSGETLRICLEEIDRCRPSAPVFFVGLLGERYGWIPPQDYFKKDVLEDPNLGWVKEHLDGKSVTELEILHGVLRNEKMRDKAFFYFRNGGYQERHWESIARHHEGMVPVIDKDDFTNAKSPTPASDSDKQEDLKRRVRDVSLKWEPKDYETPHDMAALILEDLWAAINEVFPASSVPDENDRQKLEHEAFGLSRIKGYVPRLGLFEQLDGVFTSPTPSVKIVTGESGSGKSALLAAWISNLGPRIPERHFIHYIGGTPESASVGSIIRRLMAQIRAWGAVADPIPDDLSDAVELLPTWLQRSVEGQKDGVLIVLDALNQIEKEWDKTLWWLPKDLPEGVRVVASTLTGSSQSALEKRGWTKSSVSVPLLGDDEKRTIIVSYLANFSKGLAGPLADRLVKAPQAANPLFLRVVLDELRLRARHENLASSLDKMLQAKNPVELYVQVLKNLEEFDKDRPNLVREAMGYLAAARRGLTESELLQLLSMADSPATNPLPRHLWSPLYLALEDSLVSRNGQLGFFHDYLRQAVEVEYLDEEWEREKIHGRFGEVAEAWNTERFSPSLRRYGLAHGAWHLREAGKHDRLWDLLSSGDYLSAQKRDFHRQHESITALKIGVEAFADRNGLEFEDDARLCKLVLMCGKTAENARSSLASIFAEFVAAPFADSDRVDRAFQKLSVVSEDLLFAAGQVLLMRECERAQNEKCPVDRKSLVKILECMEKGVPKDTVVPFNAQLEERLIEVLPLDIWHRMALISDKVPEGTEIQQDVWPDESERWSTSSKLTLYTVDGWRGLFCARTLARLKRWDDIDWLLSEGREKHFGCFTNAIHETLVEGLIRTGIYQRAEVLLEKLSKNEERTRLLCLLAEKLQADVPNEAKRIARMVSDFALESVDKSIYFTCRNFADTPFSVVLRAIRIFRNQNLTEEFIGTISRAKSLVLEFEHEEAKIKFLLAFADFLIEIGSTKDAEEMASCATRIIESTNTSEIKWFDPDSILELARILATLKKTDEANRVAEFIKENETRKRNSWQDEKSRDDATSFLRVRIAIFAESNEALDCERWQVLLKEAIALEPCYAFQGLNDCLEKALGKLKDHAEKDFLNYFFQECFEFFEGLDYSPEVALLAFGKLARACIDCGAIEQAYKMLEVTFSKGAKISDLFKSFNERVAEFVAFKENLLKIDEGQRLRINAIANTFLAEQRKIYKENQVYYDSYEDIPIRAMLLGLVGFNYLSLDKKELSSEVLDEAEVLANKSELLEGRALAYTAIAGLLATQAKRSQRYLDFWIKGLETSSSKGEKMMDVLLLKNLILPLLQNGNAKVAFKIINLFNQEGPYHSFYVRAFKGDIDEKVNGFLANNALAVNESLSACELLQEYALDKYTVVLFLSARIKSACAIEDWDSAIAYLDLYPEEYNYEKCVARVDMANALLEMHEKFGEQQLENAQLEFIKLMDSGYPTGCSSLGFCAGSKLFAASCKHNLEIANATFEVLLSRINKLDVDYFDLTGNEPASRNNEGWPIAIADAINGRSMFNVCEFFEKLVALFEARNKINSTNLEILVQAVCKSGGYDGIENHFIRIYRHCLTSKQDEYDSLESVLCMIAISLLGFPKISESLDMIVREIVDKCPGKSEIACALLKAGREEDFLKYNLGTYPQTWATYVRGLCQKGLISDASAFIRKIEASARASKSNDISIENLLAAKSIIALALEKKGMLNQAKELINSLLDQIENNEEHYYILFNYLRFASSEILKAYYPQLLQKAENLFSDSRSKIHATAALSLANSGLSEESATQFYKAVRLSIEPLKFWGGESRPPNKKERSKSLEFIVAAYNASDLDENSFFKKIRETFQSESDYDFIKKLEKGYYNGTGWHSSTFAEYGLKHNLERQLNNEPLQCSRWRQMLALCPSNLENSHILLGCFFESIVKQSDMHRLRVISKNVDELGIEKFL